MQDVKRILYGIPGFVEVKEHLNTNEWRRSDK